jgi:hypothetical protein
MGDPDAPSAQTGAGPDDEALARALAEGDTDEQLALALFKQFADDLENQIGERIPPDVLNDPVRYEAFVREQFERQLGRDNSRVNQQAAQLYARDYSASASQGGTAPHDARSRQESLLERVKKMPGLFRANLRSAIQSRDGATPLLSADRAPEDGTAPLQAPPPPMTSSSTRYQAPQL